jgi:hydroxyacylglutathione hydrolase
LRQLAPEVWQLRGVGQLINVYLVGDVLIDAATRRGGRRILRQVQSRPLSLLALTHFHPYHQGAAREICEARGIPLACHAAGVDAMEGREPVQQAGAGNPINRLIERFWEGPPHPVGRILREGDEVGGFRVIEAPGHAPSEVIFFRDLDRVAICGDVVNNINLLTGVRGFHEPPSFFTLDRERCRASIRLLLELEPSLVCAGHGPPIRDLSGLRRLVAGF